MQTLATIKDIQRANDNINCLPADMAIITRQRIFDALQTLNDISGYKIMPNVVATDFRLIAMYLEQYLN